MQAEVAQISTNPASPALHTPAAAPTRLGRRVLAHVSIYGLANFGVRGINFLLLPIISRFLRPADYGIVALAESIAGTIGLISGLGAATSLRRLYYDYCDDPAQTRTYVGSALRFVILSTIAVAALSWLVVPPMLNGLDKNFAIPFFPLLAIAIVTAGLGQVQQTQLSIFQVQNRPRSAAAMTILTVALATISLGWLVVWSHMGALGVLTSRLIGAISGVLATIYVSRTFLSARWNWPSLREQLRLGLPLALFDVMIFGLFFADRLILQHYRPMDEVGIYSVAYTFGSLMLTLTVSTSQAWSPLFFESAHNGNLTELKHASAALMTGLAAVATFAVILAQPTIHIILDQRYAAAAPLVPVILAAYLLHSFYSLFELLAMQAKRTNVIVIITVIAFASNIVLNLWWVPLWGAWGAAFATIAAYLVQAALMYMAVRPLAEKLYSNRAIFANLAIFAFALAVVEWPWSSTARPFMLFAVLITAMALLWPLGLKRVVGVLRTLA
jgi:O-antigen/teichoic acid export membrane protein